MNMNTRLVMVMAAAAALLGGLAAGAQAATYRTQVTVQQYEQILACMKAGGTNAYCTARVLGGGR